MLELKKDIDLLVSGFFNKVKVTAGGILVVGCSTSEVTGYSIGSHPDHNAAELLFHGIDTEAKKQGISLAVQCCEHLNRCLIIERTLAERLGLPVVNAVPQLKAGGAFATYAYTQFTDPVAVEQIQADYGIDIGLTMIGMHMKPVAVPVRLDHMKIGNAQVVCARSRPKYIGGVRAVYNDTLG